MSAKWRNLWILCAIAGLAFVLRSYRLDFPPIGYHNMQENESLSMAQEMERTGDLFTRRVYFLDAFESARDKKTQPVLALIPYQIMLAWKIFGENLWGPRLLIILFGLLNVFAIYALARLFLSQYASIGAALLMAVMPLAVFFSRNLQPQTPALFFMILGNIFYLRFAMSLKKRNLILGGISQVVAWLYHQNFLIGIVAVLFCLPWKKLWGDRKQFVLSLVAMLVPFIIAAPLFFWLSPPGQLFGGFKALIKLFEFFSPVYWREHSQMIFWYITGENFTIVFSVLAFLGVILVFFNETGLLGRYAWGWLAAIVIYGMLFNQEIFQQNYSQMPFLAFICLMALYAISFVALTLKKIINKDSAFILAILVVISASPLIYQSTMNMFRSVFLGLDVAGATLKELTTPDERIFLLTHPQGYGISRYAQRYVGWTYDLKEFKQREEAYKVRYICVYPIDYLKMLESSHPRLFEYIQAHYHFRELGFTQEPDRLYYAILERGKGQNLKDIQSLSGEKQQRAVYEMPGSSLIFFNTLKLGETK